MTPLLPPRKNDKEFKAKVASTNQVDRIPFIVHCFVMTIGVAWQMLVMQQLDGMNNLRHFLALVLDCAIVWLIVRSKGSLRVTMICWILMFASPVWLEWIVRLY